MAKGLVLCVTAAYLLASAASFIKRDWSTGLILLGYTVANVGLIWQMG